MSININTLLDDDTDAARKQAVTEVVDGLRGSRILAIAAAVRAMLAEGKEVCNLTVGDFKPSEFPVPELLVKEIQAAVAAGETNYPPSDGLPVLREAVQTSTSGTWVWTGADGVVVCSGARPVLYGTWRLSPILATRP